MFPSRVGVTKKKKSKAKRKVISGLTLVRSPRADLVFGRSSTTFALSIQNLPTIVHIELIYLTPAEGG